MLQGCLSSDQNSAVDSADGLTSSARALTATPAFPLKLSANGRYLVDQNNVPFLINQASSWGLIQSLSSADAAAYLDALKQRGFNTVMVSIISYDVRMAGSPPSWQGVSPFLTKWDFSTYNSAYFAHADEVINMAKDRGMLVTLVPVYLGYPGEPTQGWFDELLSSNNSVAKSAAYGQFLGSRYKNFTNIIWIAGGDNQPAAGSELENRLKAVIDGIRQQAPNQLWTGHWDSVAHGNGVMSSENPTFASVMNINGYYAYDYNFTYMRDLEFYNKTPVKMLYHLDQSYETEPGGTPDNIRRKAYQAMLSGAAGSSFCAGPNWWQFYNWRSNMDTQGTTETRYWYQLFSSRPWFDLVPDQSHTTLTSGYGNWGAADYVTAARTSSGSTVIAYLASQSTITVDMTRVSGTQAKAWWYDSTSGKATAIGTFPTSGSRSFTPPSGQGWALVLDDASLNLAAPGTTTTPAPAPSPPSASNTAPTVATAPRAGANPVSGISTALSVLGADDGGEANLKYTWSTAGTPPANVSFSANASNAAKSTVATFAKAGAYTLQVTIADAQGLAATASVNLTVNATLSAIAVSPATASVAPAGRVQFSASAVDQFGTAISPQPTFSWSVSGGGSVSSGGLFTAGSASGGPFSVSATSAGKSGSASVSIGAAAASSLQINAGGSAVTPFAADQAASGGGMYATSSVVSTAGVTNAAPAAVYQSERYGNFSYALSGMAPGSSHSVRLHFAEIYWTSAGNRLFNVSINGSQVLTNFDIVTAAGGARIALIKDFAATADAAGKITVAFSTVRDNAKVSAIEVR